MHGCSAVQGRAHIAVVPLMEGSIQPGDVKQAVRVVVDTLVKEE